MSFWSSITEPFTSVNPVNWLTLGTNQLGISSLGAAKNAATGAASGAGLGGGTQGNQFDPYTGMPIAPDFQILGQAGRDEISNRALGTEPSRWAQLAQQQQQADELKNLGNASASAQGSLAQAQGALARGGGLTSGANAALASQAMRDSMKQRQDVRAQGATNRTNIGLQDEQQRTNLLSGLVGTDSAAQQNAYNQQMQAWAAGQQGNAILKANQPGLLGQLTGGLKLF